MTAHECLEHKWLMESIEKNSRQNGSTSTTIVGDIHNGEKKTPPLPPKPSFLRRSSIKPINYESNATSSSSPITIHNSNASDIIVDQALNATNEFCTKNDCLKSNNVATLLEDYTNKENINLSKILANRTSTTINAKGISLNNLNSNSNHNNSPSKSNLDYADNTSASSHSDVAIMSTTHSIPPSINAAPSTKYEQSLFPDAPTTPKVCRKSMSDASTPASVALVKQFQMNHKANANEFVCTDGDSASDTYMTSTKYILSTLRSGNDELVVSGASSSSSVNHVTTTDTYHYRTTVSGTCNQSPTSIPHLQPMQYPSTHHHLHHITRSSNSHSSTLTSTTNSVNDILSSPSSNTSTRCLCDKSAQATSSCCCSTTTLFRREKSIAVVDNSILC